MSDLKIDHQAALWPFVAIGAVGSFFIAPLLRFAEPVALAIAGIMFAVGITCELYGRLRAASVWERRIASWVGIAGMAWLSIIGADAATVAH